MNDQKEKFRDELIIALTPFIQPGCIEAVKAKITILTHGYEISKAENEIVVYEGDVNERIVKRYLMAKTAQGLSKRTIEYYQQTLELFFGEIQKPFSQITADDIRYWIALKLSRDGISKTGANNYRRNISAFYTWLQKEEILLKNPMNKVPPLKETKKKKHAFELIDLELIRMGCRDERQKAMVEMLASTWCRADELINIRTEDIEEGRVMIHGKGDKYRYVFINARAKLAVEVYMNQRKDKNPYLFPMAKNVSSSIEKYSHHAKETGTRTWEWWKDPAMVADDGHIDASTLGAIVRKIGQRAGVKKVHPHRFRRTGATMALRSGMPITTVSKLLGHESIETTQIYLDISDKDLEQAHEKYVI